MRKIPFSFSDIRRWDWSNVVMWLQPGSVLDWVGFRYMSFAGCTWEST